LKVFIRTIASTKGGFDPKSAELPVVIFNWTGRRRGGIPDLALRQAQGYALQASGITGRVGFQKSIDKWE
jgi:hypothetical protein